MQFNRSFYYLYSFFSRLFRGVAYLKASCCCNIKHQPLRAAAHRHLHVNWQNPCRERDEQKIRPTEEKSWAPFSVLVLNVNMSPCSDKNSGTAVPPPMLIPLATAGFVPTFCLSPSSSVAFFLKEIPSSVFCGFSSQLEGSGLVWFGSPEAD